MVERIEAAVAIDSLDAPTDMLLFGVFLAPPYDSRGRPDVHKRWIISATAALGGAAMQCAHRDRVLQSAAVRVSHLARCRRGDAAAICLSSPA